MAGPDTQCSGLVEKVVVDQRLDSMTLEVFPNLSGSMILSFESPLVQERTSRPFSAEPVRRCIGLTPIPELWEHKELQSLLQAEKNFGFQNMEEFGAA